MLALNQPLCQARWLVLSRVDGSFYARGNVKENFLKRSTWVCGVRGRQSTRHLAAWPPLWRHTLRLPWQPVWQLFEDN